MGDISYSYIMVRLTLCVMSIGSLQVHKRFDPMYLDARDKIQGLGPFSYMYR
jgi:hypothetical protein